MPKLTPTQYAQALYDAVLETKDHDVVLNNFVKILAQNGDLAKHDEIQEEYRKIDMKAKGIKEVQTTFAHDLHNNHQIVEELNKVVKGKAEFKSKIDENIIGGVVIRVDDTLIDASVKTQLRNLNKSLKF